MIPFHVNIDEHQLLSDIEKLIKQRFPRVVVPGFGPNRDIKPEPTLDGRQSRQKPRDERRSPSATAKPLLQKSAKRKPALPR